MKTSFLTPDQHFAAAPGGCQEPRLSSVTSKYCFGETDLEEQAEFEAHILVCDICWREIQRLDAVVGILRGQQRILETELAGAFLESLQISSKLAKPWGGHGLKVLFASLMYAMLFSLSIAIEVAYEFDSYRWLVLPGAPLIFVWVAASALGAFHMLHRQIIRHRTGPAWSAALLIAAGSLTCASVWPFLPDHPVTLASVQTYTARAAYLKDTAYFLAVALLLLVPPLASVLTIQRELQKGQHLLVARLLSGDKSAIPPPKSSYVPLWILSTVFVLMLVIALLMMTHLLDNLLSGPYLGLLQTLLWLRLGCFFVLGLAVLAWYRETMWELQREALTFAASKQA